MQTIQLERSPALRLALSASSGAHKQELDGHAISLQDIAGKCTEYRKLGVAL